VETNDATTHSLPAMSPLLIKLGKCIRQRREDLGLSQESLANRAEVHRTYVGKVERGEQNVSMLSLSRIAKGLGAFVWEIIREAEE
jgi:transcriptional regulator with XRE-family HTH domain